MRSLSCSQLDWMQLCKFRDRWCWTDLWPDYCRYCSL